MWVLVVEDDEATQQLLAEVLEDAGYEVRAAPSGEAALQAVRRVGHPGIILLDGLLPRMDGATFLRRYRRRRGPHAPVVAISGSEPAAERMRDVGADAVLIKPLELRELIAVIGRYATPVPGSSRAA